jgi:hypothetical protein
MESIQSKKFGGLEKNPTYLELINYIETNNDKIKMPDRRAKFLRNSFYLSQLDGEGMRRQEEQEQLKDREADKDLMIKKFAEDFGLQLQGIKQYLQRRGLEPVRRISFQTPATREPREARTSRTPMRTPERGRTPMRTIEQRRVRSKRRETRYHSPQSSEEEQQQMDEDLTWQIKWHRLRKIPCVTWKKNLKRLKM